MTKPFRILIADDHDVVRKGMRALLESHAGWEVCGEAQTGREAVEKARELRPDLVVIDVSMPELNGIDAARQIKKTCPQAEVVVITQHDADQVVREVLESGARGYVLKSDSAKELVAAVEALQNHRPYFTSRATELLMDGFNNPKPISSTTPIGERLTTREREIVQLIAEGHSSKQVAGVLNISTKTAETHRANAMRKLDLHSLSELVMYAVRNKIVQP